MIREILGDDSRVIPALPPYSCVRNRKVSDGVLVDAEHIRDLVD